MNAASRDRIGVGNITIGPKEKKYIARVLDSGRLSYGPMTRRFEAGFSRAHGCRFGVFCNSGTSALHIALAALKEMHGWKDGDEVLVPSVTFVATANIVLHNRMRPVFVDVDSRTYNIDPAEIQKKASRRVRAIIPVHLLGLPCDMDPILRIARSRRWKIIEDSCETAFAKYRGRTVGSFGDIACFSTYIAHYIVTGVGGFALTSDRDIAVRLRSLMNHGRDSIYLSVDDGASASGRRLKEIVARRFRFVSLGHSFRATEMEAAIGLAQLEARRTIVRKRLANARRLTEGLLGLEDRLQLPYAPPDREHMFMMYPIVLRSESKVGLVNFLEARGVETRDIPPVINQPVYRRMFGDLESKYPVARWINRSGFYVGCHPSLDAGHMDRIADLVHQYLKKR